MSKNNSHEDFLRTFLDPEEILLNLLRIRKFQREVDEWVKSTNILLEGKESMMRFKPDVTPFIEMSLDDLNKFSDNIKEIVEKVTKLIDRYH